MWLCEKGWLSFRPSSVNRSVRVRCYSRENRRSKQGRTRFLQFQSNPCNNHWVCLSRPDTSICLVVATFAEQSMGPQLLRNRKTGFRTVHQQVRQHPSRLLSYDCNNESPFSNPASTEQAPISTPSFLSCSSFLGQGTSRIVCSRKKTHLRLRRAHPSLHVCSSRAALS